MKRKYMRRIRYVMLAWICMVSGTVALAQKNERDYLRNGNKLYEDSLYVKAEVEYRKALDANPKSTEALYNLGNALMMQQKGKEAMEQFDAASKVEKNKMKLSKIYHNMGVMLQASQQYPLCIEAYKKALRNNPKDDETRYNLALAQKLLKDQPQNNNQQNNDNKDQDKEDDKKQNEQNKENPQQDQDKQEQQPPQQDEPQKDQMSKENAQQLLNAVMQDEKEVQDKVKKQLQMKGKKYDKDW